MFRTAVLGALIACIPAVVAAAWPQPAPESTAAWNSPEYDALWISLSGAEDELISLNDLVEATNRPLRVAGR